MKQAYDHIVLFDGDCNLCSFAVQFIIRHDKENKFRFASLQSAFGQAISAKHHLPTASFDTFIYLRNDTLYFKSGAALHLLKELGYPWRLLYAFIIVPRFLRDAIYMFVSRNRHRLFRRPAACMMPTRELQEKFII